MPVIKHSGSRGRRRALIATTISASLLLVALPQTPALASTTLNPATTKSGAAVGLLVHYKPGFEANGFLGQLAGQSAVAAVGIPLGSQRALAHGWHVLNFASAASSTSADLAVAALKQQPGVTDVSISRFLAAPDALAPAKRPGSLLARLLSQSGLAQAFKASLAPQKVAAKDAWSWSAPSTTAVNVTWAKPKNTFGYKLAGYVVQTSIDGGVSVQTIPTTYSATTTKAALSSGLTAGVPLQVRVAAITKSGKVEKTGAYSKWVKVTPTGLPAAPAFSDGPVSTLSPSVSWQALTPAQTGGLLVTFDAVASSPKLLDVTCRTTETSCAFKGLVAGASYQVKVRANNAHGSSDYVTGKVVNEAAYSNQWYLNDIHGINIEQAWPLSNGSGITVAVVDGGITPHPELDSQEWQNQDGSVYGYDFVSDPVSANDGDGWDANPSDPGGPDSNGEHHAWHATHVSGIIAAAQNGSGIVGVAPGAKLLEVRALGNSGGTSADLIASLQWAAGFDVPGVPTNVHPAKVVNLSLGELTLTGCDDATASTMQALHDAGITVVTAAGNDALPAVFSYPGDCFPTINVGATGSTGDSTYYSNYGLGVDISAPGGDDTVKTMNARATNGMIYSTYNDGVGTPGNPSYENLEGTSMATPIIAGIAALIYSDKPNLTPDQVWNAIKITAAHWGPKTDCYQGLVDQNGSPNDPTIVSCGVGIADAGAAVIYAHYNL
jgi:serine protease